MAIKKVMIDLERMHNLNSGLGQFCWQLLQQWERLETADLDVELLLPPNFKQPIASKFTSKTANWLQKIYFPASKYDIWHTTHQGSPYLPSNKNTKLIITVHDLNFLERADYSESKKQRKLSEMKRKLDKATQLVAISNFTKQTLSKELSIDTEKIKVIYNGNNLNQNLLGEPNRNIQKLAQKPYFFSIGIIHPKKNFHVLLPILEEFAEHHLLIAGQKNHPYAEKIMQEAQKMGVSQRVHLLGTITEVEKKYLYQHSEALLFPSLSEGFGLPVIEAMSLGKLVFLSNLTSLPEIGGDLAYYFPNFDPQNVIHTLKNGLKEYAADKENKSKLLQHRANHFSWQQAAQDYLDLYRNIF